jgi:hypothetical protein
MTMCKVFLTFSILRWGGGGGKTPTQLGPLERLIEISSFCGAQVRMETDPVSETWCFLCSGILEDGKSPKPSNCMLGERSTYAFLFERKLCK